MAGFTEREVIADPIADLRSTTGSLISVYAQRPAPGGFSALLADLLRPIRDRADHMDRNVAKAVRFDADRIHRLGDRFEMGSAPGYAVFASEGDGIFVIEQLAHEVANVAMIGPRPYMRPLRAAPRGLRSGVLVADHSLARAFIASGGVIAEIGEPLRADIGKANYGGFAGYDEHVVRSRAGEATARIWKMACQLLLDAHQVRPLDYVALGGQGETIDEVARSLHPYLARLPRVDFPANPGGVSLQAIRAELAGYDEEIRRSRQGDLAGRLCDVARSGGNAVLGLGATLDAANTQAIDTLVVAGDFARSGSMCQVCSHLTRAGGPCQVCGSPMFEIDDVVAATMEVTINSGGNVHQIEVASDLDVDGIGALTRFPVAL